MAGVAADAHSAEPEGKQRVFLRIDALLDSPLDGSRRLNRNHHAADLPGTDPATIRPQPGVNKSGQMRRRYGVLQLQVPLEIAFHNIESSDWAEQEIRARVADLEKLYDRLISCRDPDRPARQATAPARSRRWSISSSAFPATATSWSATSPSTCMRKYQRPDLHKAINEAFRIAERQLARPQGAARRPHQGRPSRFRATSRSARSPRSTPERRLRLPAHQGGRPALLPPQRACCPAISTISQRGDEVHYVEDVGDTGPIASKVRVKRTRHD